MTATQSRRGQYEAPALRVAGPIADLTKEQDKKLGPTDGLTFMGQAITNASP